MSFLWPELLWIYFAVPAVVALYIALLRMPAKHTVAYPALALFGASADATYRWKTHLPALLVLAALCALLASGARPVIGDVRRYEPRTLILTIDVSYSMAAADVAPTRLDVARRTAAAIAEWQPADVLVGIVAFSGNAQLVQTPTASRAAVRKALERLELQSGSALGTGILGSLMTLFPEAQLAGGYDVFGHYVPRFAYPPIDRAAEGARASVLPERVRAGSNALARIVVLSDGQSTHGVPIEAARSVAANRGVRVFAIGIGTAAGGTIEVAGQHYRAGMDEKTLLDVASRTQGRYWRVAESADVDRLEPHVRRATAYEPRVHEISVYLNALALGLLLAAAALASYARFAPPRGAARIRDPAPTR
jgi:Ca-activated chloride channel family protein